MSRTGGHRVAGAIRAVVVAGALAALALQTACAPSRSERLAASGAPVITEACRREALADPTVRQMMVAAAAVSDRLAEDQISLAFARAEAERKCMEQKGLMRGGVEPVRYRWYPSPF